MLSNSKGLTSSNIYLFIIWYGPLVSLINMSILASLKLLSGQQYCHNFTWGQIVTRHIDPVDCSPAGSSVYGISQARILEWVAIFFFLQGAFPTQGLNLGLLYCRQTLYLLSHQEAQVNCGNHFIMYANVKSLCSTL